MASIYPRADSSGSLQCAVHVPTAHGGTKRVRGSIGTADKKLAGKIAERVQDLADALSPKKKRTQAQLTRYIGAIFDAADVPPPWEITSSSVSFDDFAKGWVDRKRRGASTAAYNQANAAITSFRSHIGNKQMSAIKGEHVQTWHDAMAAASYASNTINVRLSVIKAIFRHALNIGAIRVNPAAEIQVVKGETVIDRQEFPDDVFQRLFRYLSISCGADGKAWCNAMMIARYAGLRLRDAVGVEWSNFSVDKADDLILCYTAGKTGRTVCIPIFNPLADYIRPQAAGATGHACEGLQDKSASYLSERFAKLIEMAGIENAKKAVASGRQYSGLTFHGLRHAFITDLAKRGVPENLRMILSDHSTSKAHRGYNHSQASDLAAQIAPFFK